MIELDSEETTGQAERIFPDPAFVLCSGRSGSTLLRFLLDAHPELACPPETNLPALCGQLATVWSLIEGAPLSDTRGDEPPAIPDAAIAGIRQTMDRMLGSYLDRRQKARYCDKSLGTARFAKLLLRVYPEAKFICLYRHPMDLIASGIEACPWGLNGYGFSEYIASTPGNSVLALARFWIDSTSATMTVEETFPERCHRVRYEDMVTDPEGVADEIFSFLGVPSVPGISRDCFSRERERFGPGDHKIWYTSEIKADSLGRGWAIPAALIPDTLRASMTDLTDKLGFIPVRGEWGTSEPPADFRADVVARPAGRPAPAGPTEPSAQLLGDRLRRSIHALGDDFSRRWGGRSAESFVAISLPAGPSADAARWLVNLADRTVTLAGEISTDSSDWDVIGSGEAWASVIRGRTNLSVALRACQLRYCDAGDPGLLATEARIALLAELLGLVPA